MKKKVLRVERCSKARQRPLRSRRASAHLTTRARLVKTLGQGIKEEEEGGNDSMVKRGQKEDISRSKDPETRPRLVTTILLPSPWITASKDRE
jgi:hypothetical protein